MKRYKFLIFAIFIQFTILGQINHDFKKVQRKKIQTISFDNEKFYFDKAGRLIKYHNRLPRHGEYYYEFDSIGNCTRNSEFEYHRRHGSSNSFIVMTKIYDSLRKIYDTLEVQKHTWFVDKTKNEYVQLFEYNVDYNQDTTPQWYLEKKTNQQYYKKVSLRKVEEYNVDYLNNRYDFLTIDTIDNQTLVKQFGSFRINESSDTIFEGFTHLFHYNHRFKIKSISIYNDLLQTDLRFTAKIIKQKKGIIYFKIPNSQNKDEIVEYILNPPPLFSKIPISLHSIEFIVNSPMKYIKKLSKKYKNTNPDMKVVISYW